MGQQVETKIIEATGVRDLAPGDIYYVSRVQFEVVGITAAGGSATPQIKSDTGVTYYNAQYTNLPTQAIVTAGTAITADGIYEVIVDGCIAALNVGTLGSASWSVKVTPLAG